MEVSTLLLADYASRDQGGKFTLVGAGITEIKVRQVPFVHPLIFLFLRIQTTIQDLGKNKIQILIKGKQGTLFQSEGDITVTPEHYERREIPIPFQLAGLKFPAEGEYIVEVMINNTLKQSQHFRVLVHQPPQKDKAKGSE